MQWFRAKMNVRLAVETLSNSVADSMQFLMEKNFDEFANASATIDFIRVFNNIFDVMNSKKIVTSNTFKSAINPLNQEYIFCYFDYAISYLKTLKMSDKSLVLTSQKKTSFRGFIINMIALKAIYAECVESGLLEYLPTFKFSQDHLESFFGRIRSMNGYNDNPNVEQFCSAFRKIVINNEIKCTEFSNCLDTLHILSVSSRRPKLKTNEKEQNLNVTNVTEFDLYLDSIEHDEEIEKIEKCDFLLEDLEHTSISFSAGWIEKKIQTADRYLCADCINVFFENDKITDSIQSPNTQTVSNNVQYL